MSRRPPRATRTDTLFPYTALFRSGQRALEWLQAAGVQDPYKQVVAITARPDVAQDWGVPSAHVFKLWDWVGGRFSLWSAVSRSEEHTSELQSLMRISYAVFCLKKKKLNTETNNTI